MEKVLAVLIIVVMFLVFYPKYTKNDIDKMQNEWDEKYYALEEEMYAAQDKADKYFDVLNDVSEEFSTVYCYYVDHDDYISESEALAAIEKIDQLLYGY